MEFIDAEYVPAKGGGGRKAEPNEFTEIINAIALKQNPAGKPLAKGIIIKHPFGSDASIVEVKAARNKLTRAGHANDPKVSVYAVPSAHKQGHGAVAKDYTLLTFWTTAFTAKPRKAAEPDVTATVEPSK
jgi:hypothetical protein